MKWTPGTKNEHVVDIRGQRASAVPKVAGIGAGATIIVFLVSRLLGVDVSGLVGGGNSTTTGSAAPLQGSDADAPLVDYINFVMKDVQDTFAGLYQSEGKRYPYANLYIFTQSVDTGCGRSTAAIGPFYCPPDSGAYIDLSFYRELKARFGAPGDFAQAYVLAHEIGHHLQNLTRAEGHEPARRPGETKNEYSVRVELQADCYAGVWGSHAKGRQLLEQGDLEEALTAATAIGDDHLQQDAGMAVNPETFTHGSSAQRVKWFRKGFETGRLEACDTFGGDL